MPEGSSTSTPEVPAWVSQLPDDLKQNATFTSFKTIGDLGKSYIETMGKVTEMQGKLEHSIPKLPDDATDEDRSLYYDALGRPKQPSEYEFEGEDKNAPEWTNYWKQTAHELGLTKPQAKALSAKFNAQMQKMVDGHNASVKNEITSSEQKLRSEYGDKFDANVELAKRMWTKYGEGEFDKAFENGNSAYRATTIKMLIKFASLTGEDRSPQGGMSQTGKVPQGMITYDKSPAPPKKS